MAVWLGGLVTLTVFLLRRTHPRVLGVILPAWSRWAAIAVVWLVGGGVVQAVVQVGSVGALWQHRLRTVAARQGRDPGGDAGRGRLRPAARAARARCRPPAPARLRRTVGIEVAATAVVLGLSAVLVQVNPGRSATVDAGRGRATRACRRRSPARSTRCSSTSIRCRSARTTRSTRSSTPRPARRCPPSSGPSRPSCSARTSSRSASRCCRCSPAHHAVGAITFPLRRHVRDASSPSGSGETRPSYRQNHDLGSRGYLAEVTFGHRVLGREGGTPAHSPAGGTSPCTCPWSATPTTSVVVTVRGNLDVDSATVLTTTLDQVLDRPARGSRGGPVRHPVLRLDRAERLRRWATTGPWPAAAGCDWPDPTDFLGDLLVTVGLTPRIPTFPTVAEALSART